MVHNFQRQLAQASKTGIPINEITQKAIEEMKQASQTSASGSVSGVKPLWLEKQQRKDKERGAH